MRYLQLNELALELVAATGSRIHELVRELHPVMKSITGEGLRTTVRRLSGVVPLDIMEVPTGTAVFDWTIPDEWSIDEAYHRA